MQFTNIERTVALAQLIDEMHDVHPAAIQECKRIVTEALDKDLLLDKDRIMRSAILVQLCSDVSNLDSDRDWPPRMKAEFTTILHGIKLLLDLKCKEAA